MTLVGVAVLSLAACIPPYQGNPRGPKVAVIGDSITFDANGAIHAQLDAGHWVSVDGRSGHTVADMQPSADEYAATGPDVVIVNLGTNDAIQGRSVLFAALGLLYMASKFPNACVVLTTINEHTNVAAWNAFARELNGGVRMGRHIDWSAAAADPRMTRDSVHPTNLGARVLAFLTAQAVRACA